jgi:hypothetical protein
VNTEESTYVGSDTVGLPTHLVAGIATPYREYATVVTIRETLDRFGSRMAGNVALVVVHSMRDPARLLKVAHRQVVVPTK